MAVNLLQSSTIMFSTSIIYNNQLLIYSIMHLGDDRYNCFLKKCYGNLDLFRFKRIILRHDGITWVASIRERYIINELITSIEHYLEKIKNFSK
jgi:hypothetical protein